MSGVCELGGGVPSVSLFDSQTINISHVSGCTPRTRAPHSKMSLLPAQPVVCSF